MLIRAQESSHWYEQDGTPMYQVECTTKPGQYRDTTKRDARKLNLLPSVTSILGTIKSGNLEAWKIEQGILAALTLPRIENEPDDSFAKRVAIDAKETARKAAEFGKRVHKASGEWAEAYEKGLVVPPIDKDLWPALDGYTEWHKNNVLKTIFDEKPFASELGYAGKIDRLFLLKTNTKALVDIKTRGTKAQPENPSL